MQKKGNSYTVVWQKLEWQDIMEDIMAIPWKTTKQQSHQWVHIKGNEMIGSKRRTPMVIAVSFK